MAKKVYILEAISLINIFLLPLCFSSTYTPSPLLDVCEQGVEVEVADEEKLCVTVVKGDIYERGVVV